MAKLLNYFPSQSPFTFVPAGVIAAGQPVGFNGQLCAADAKCIGINMYDVDLTTPSGAVQFGLIELIAGGAIAQGDPIKVGAGGKFLSGATDTSVNAAKNVGRAFTAASGVDVKFMAFIVMPS